MIRPRALLVTLVIALAICSCAGPNKLARQSEEAYQKGDYSKAYEKAERALDKEPGNERALQAMTAAATKLVDQRKTEILSLAATDTVSAAYRVLSLDEFREGLSRHHAGVPADSDFDRKRRQILDGAAGILYRRGRADLDAGSPKRAYDEFLTAEQFVPAYADAGRRARQAYDGARPRIAILPFSNQTDVSGLSKELADQGYAKLSREVRPPGFRFTELLDRDLVYAVVPVLLLDEMNRKEALRVGRELDADRVLVGRLYGLRSSTNTGSYSQTVFQKVVERDEKGVTRERYTERALEILVRDKEVNLRFEYQVLDVADGSVVAAHSGPAGAEAHSIYAMVSMPGEFGDYFLVSPEIRRSDPDRAKRIEEGWRDHCGTWTLPEVLERARKERHRTGRRPDFWSEPEHHKSRMRPIFVEDLPPERELALSGLEPLWRQVLHTLRQVDAREP